MTKRRAGIRWNTVDQKVWKHIGGNQEEVMSAGKAGRYKAELEERTGKRERLALRNKVSSEKHLEISGGLREGVGMKTHLYGPAYFAKTLKLLFRHGDLDLPEKRKRYTSSLEEEDVDVQMCPCGKAIDSRTHIAGECEVFKEERDVLEEEMREIDECGIEEIAARKRSLSQEIDSGEKKE